MQHDVVRGDATERQEQSFPPDRVPWTIAEGLALFVLFVLIHAVCGVLIGRFAPGRYGVPLQLGAGNAAILTVIYLLLRQRFAGARRPWRLIGLCPPGAARAVVRALVPLSVGVVALLGCLFLRIRVLWYFDVQIPEQELVRSLRDMVLEGAHLEFGMLSFFAVVVAPVVEELTYRGLLYLPLRSRLGRVWAAVVVSVLFAAIHQNVAAAGHLFILGLVFTELMEVTGSMLTPMLAHACHNGIMITLIALIGSRT